MFSWEPVICHDTVDMGWTTLGDTCIHDGKLLGCSYYRNSVGVWAADLSVGSTIPYPPTVMQYIFYLYFSSSSDYDCLLKRLLDGSMTSIS